MTQITTIIVQTIKSILSLNIIIYRLLNNCKNTQNKHNTTAENRQIRHYTNAYIEHKTITKLTYTKLQKPPPNNQNKIY